MRPFLISERQRMSLLPLFLYELSSPAFFSAPAFFSEKSSKNFFRRKNIVTDRSKNSISLDMSCNGGRLSEN